MKSPQLAHGFDTIKDLAMPTSIFTDYFSKKNVQDFRDIRFPMERELTLSLVTSKSELADKMNIYGEVSVSYGVATGTGKVNFLKETGFSNTSMYLLVTSRIISRIERLKDLPHEADVFNEDFPVKDKEFFILRYGDAFVSEIRYGGELYILFELRASSENELEQWKAELEVKMGPISGRAQIESIKKKFEAHLEVNVRLIENGNKDAGGDFTTLDGMIKKAEEFYRGITKTSDHIIDFSLIPYKNFGQALNELDPVYETTFSEFKEKAFEVFQDIDKIRADIELIHRDAGIAFYLGQEVNLENHLMEVQKLIGQARQTYGEFYDLRVGGRDKVEELAARVETLQADYRQIKQQMPQPAFLLTSSVVIDVSSQAVGPQTKPDIQSPNYFNPLLINEDTRRPGVRLRKMRFFTLGWKYAVDYQFRGYFVDLYGYEQIRAIELVYEDANGNAIPPITMGSKNFIPTKTVIDTKIQEVYPADRINVMTLFIGDETDVSLFDGEKQAVVMEARSGEEKEVKNILVSETDWRRISRFVSLTRLEKFAVESVTWLNVHEHDVVATSFASADGEAVVTFAAIEPQFEDFAWFSSTPLSPTIPHDLKLLESASAPMRGIELFGLHGFYKDGLEGEKIIGSLSPIWRVVGGKKAASITTKKDTIAAFSLLDGSITLPVADEK